VLVALAGLPGTGKSTLAVGLATALGAVVLDKDRVRAALFPPAVLDFSREQDDVCMDAVYRAAGLLLRRDPDRIVIVDGRTFLGPGQLDPLFALGREVGQPPRLVECICDDHTARERLEAGRRTHPAGNRDFTLYRALKASAFPLPAGRLILDTTRASPEECLRRCLKFLPNG
jgi:adenylylsulfate kinase